MQTWRWTHSDTSICSVTTAKLTMSMLASWSAMTKCHIKKSAKPHKKGGSACFVFGPFQMRCFCSGWLPWWKWCIMCHATWVTVPYKLLTWPVLFPTDHGPHFSKIAPSLNDLQTMEYKGHSEKKCLKSLTYLYPGHIFLKCTSTNTFCCYEQSIFAVWNACVASYRQGKSYSVHSDS